MQNPSMPTATGADTSEIGADFAQPSALTRPAQTPREQQHLQEHMQTPSLQHTATHCNSLQHPATHCNTLQSNVLNVREHF